MLAHRFFGQWRLIPELCKYQAGQAPQKAIYSFAFNEQTQLIDVSISWTDKQNKDFAIKYEIELNKKKADKLNNVNIQVYHQLTQKGILQSATFDESGSIVLMKSSRELKENDKKLEVIMETSPGSNPVRIFQIYQKIE